MATTGYLHKIAAEKKTKKVLPPYNQILKGYDTEVRDKVIEHKVRVDRKIHHKERVIKK